MRSHPSASVRTFGRHLVGRALTATMTLATATYSIRQPLAVTKWLLPVAAKIYGRVPKGTKGTDCKSVIRRFESDLGLSPRGGEREKYLFRVYKYFCNKYLCERSPG